MRLNKRVVVRMVPDEPNPCGSSDRSCVTARRVRGVLISAGRQSNAGALILATDPS